MSVWVQWSVWWGLCLAAMGAVAQQRCDADTARWSTPSARFEDNGDGTVTDKRLKLTWMRCSAGQSDVNGACAGEPSRLGWLQAQAYATDLNQRGSLFFNDWRLPLLRELAAIAEARCANPRINLGVFPMTPAAFFWSASARAGEGAPTQAYALSFGAEGVEIMDKKEAMHVRLVRVTH